MITYLKDLALKAVLKLIPNISTENLKTILETIEAKNKTYNYRLNLIIVHIRQELSRRFR